MNGDGYRGRGAKRYASMQENVEEYAKDIRSKYMTFYTRSNRSPKAIRTDTLTSRP